MKWTVFKVKRNDPEKKIWFSELNFYMGPENVFKNIDFDNDWRFKEVEGKREKAVLLGEAELEDSDFPIKYPLSLKNEQSVFEISKEICSLSSGG